MRSFITFILGIALGAGTVAAILLVKSNLQPAVSDRAQVAAPTVEDRSADLESRLASARARLEEAERMNDRLTARIQESSRKESAEPAPAANPFAAMFGGNSNEMSAAVIDMLRSQQEQEVEAKLSGLKAKLKLTPEQEAAIRDTLTRGMEKTIELVQKMYQGETSFEELGQSARPAAGEEEQIKSLLTAEQAAAYDEYKEEETRRMTRLVANSELLQLQSSLNLNDEQQDKVFAILVEHTGQQFVSPSENEPATGHAARKTEALRSVLTPEQFERYQKHQEQQRKLIESLMPKGATGTVHSTTIISPMISP